MDNLIQPSPKERPSSESSEMFAGRKDDIIDLTNEDRERPNSDVEAIKRKYPCETISDSDSDEFIASKKVCLDHDR